MNRLISSSKLLFPISCISERTRVTVRVAVVSYDMAVGMDALNHTLVRLAILANHEECSWDFMFLENDEILSRGLGV